MYKTSSPFRSRRIKRDYFNKSNSSKRAAFHSLPRETRQNYRSPIIAKRNRKPFSGWRWSHVW